MVLGNKIVEKRDGLVPVLSSSRTEGTDNYWFYYD